MRANLYRSGVGLTVLALGALGAAACDSSSGSSSTVPQDYFDGNESAALGAATNEATCATCHASSAGVTGNPGDSLRNIAFHTSFKGGGAPTLLDATNACVTGWMGGTALTASDASWKELEKYLQSISDPAQTTPNTLTPQVLADLAAYEAMYATGGDATAGEAAFAQSCARCHSGALKLGATAAVPKSSMKLLTAGEIARQVRTSGPPPSSMSDAADVTPGPMPFFEPDELPEQTLKDIIAYVLSE